MRLSADGDASANEWSWAHRAIAPAADDRAEQTGRAAIAASRSRSGRRVVPDAEEQHRPHRDEAQRDRDADDRRSRGCVRQCGRAGAPTRAACPRVPTMPARERRRRVSCRAACRRVVLRADGLARGNRLSGRGTTRRAAVCRAASAGRHAAGRPRCSRGRHRPSRGWRRPIRPDRRSAPGERGGGSVTRSARARCAGARRSGGTSTIPAGTGYLQARTLHGDAPETPCSPDPDHRRARRPRFSPAFGANRSAGAQSKRAARSTARPARAGAARTGPRPRR